MQTLYALAKRTSLFLPAWLRGPLQARHYARMVGSFTPEDEPDLEVVRHLAGAGDTVLDLGASIGMYTRVLSHRVGEAGRVVSVEPVPETFAVLSRTVRSLGLANATVLNVAVSDAEGWATMEVPRLDWGGEDHYCAHLVDGGPASGNRRVRVRTATADSIARGLGRVDFVKMDVEGHELSVLAGAAWLLDEVKPAWLIEVSGDPDDPAGGAARLFARMAEAGYGAWRYAGGRLAERRVGDSSVNYFFLTPAHVQRLVERAPGLIGQD
ncbi:MAG TPA: FkbM family methyltransferase [Longimicrobium sp.]|nr:FkbM family methyltransferase [Longimicrobium sp.]